MIATAAPALGAVARSALNAMVRPYPETRVSTNLLAGDDDRLVSPARRSFRLQRALPLAALTRAPEGGHELHRTQT